MFHSKINISDSATISSILNFAKKGSKKDFNLQLLSPADVHILNVRAKIFKRRKRIKKGYIPLNVTYIDPITGSFSTTIQVKINDISKILHVKKKEVKKFWTKGLLEEKLSTRLKTEPTCKELNRLKEANTGLKDEQLVQLLRFVKELETAPEEMTKKKYEIELPENWKQNGVRIKSQKLPCVIYMDHLGGTYIQPDVMKKGKSAYSIKGEFIENIDIRISLLKSAEPTDEQVNKLATPTTGLNKNEAIKLLRFTKMYEIDPFHALKYVGYDSGRMSDIYLPKEKTKLPRSLIISQNGRIYILLKGHNIAKLGKGTFKIASLAISPGGKLFANLSIRSGTRGSPQFSFWVNAEDVGNDEYEIYSKIKESAQPNDGSRYVLELEALSPPYEHKKIRKIAIFAEYCNKGVLSPKLMRKFPKKQRCEFFLKSMQGLQFLHDTAGYVQCDLKPDNILCKTTKEGLEPRISDFGTMHNIGTKLKDVEYGTPFFQAPEMIARARSEGYVAKRYKIQLNSEEIEKLIPDQLSGKQDVFSLGASIYAIINESDKPPWISKFCQDCFNFENLPKIPPKMLNICYSTWLSSKITQDQSTLGITEPEDHNSLEYVAYLMVHPNPKLRITLSKAIKMLSKIIEKMPE